MRADQSRRKQTDNGLASNGGNAEVGVGIQNPLEGRLGAAFETERRTMGGAGTTTDASVAAVSRDATSSPDKIKSNSTPIHDNPRACLRTRAAPCSLKPA